MYLNQIYFARRVRSGGRADLLRARTPKLTLLNRRLAGSTPASYRSKSIARKRQEIMPVVKRGFTVRADRSGSTAERPIVRRPGSEHLGPYFVEIHPSALVAKFGEPWSAKGGLEVLTTLNADITEAAEAAVFNGLREVAVARLARPAPHRR